MQNAILFNCCTHGAEPDWSEFVGLEIGGCRMSDDEDGCVEGGQDLASSTFLTVYGRMPCGEAVAITDTDDADLPQAQKVAAALAQLSNLPVTLHCALESAPSAKDT